MLGRLDDKPGRVILADCAGGIFVAGLGQPDVFDVAVVVVEPYPRAGEVARRLLAMFAAEAPRTCVVVVANKIAGEADLAAVRRFLPDVNIDVVIPLDPAVVRADAEGRAPFDVAPEGTAVRAVHTLASSLVEAQSALSESGVRASE